MKIQLVLEIIYMCLYSAIADNIEISTSITLCAWNHHENSPVAGHREPEVVRVGVIKVCRICPECDVLFIFIIVLLGVNYKVCYA